MSTAFITGITGQDGSYLAELLLEKNYKVIGLVSSKYNIGFENIDHFKDQVILEEGDLLDKDSLEKIFEKYAPDEVYNLAGITYVPSSWEKPTLTLDINTLGLSRILELGVQKFPKTKIFQASSSRMFGNPSETPQNETTPLQPQEPYSVSKVAAHYLLQTIRQHFNFFVSSAIMYNHESERRGIEFVTRKITHTAAQIKLGLAESLELGDLDVQQDWGYAPDYVEAMWLMLQQDKPDDFILASGKPHTVRDICTTAFDYLQLDYADYVRINPDLIRKEKYKAPCGDASKAQKVLNWHPKVSFEEMIIKMVEHDLNLLKTN